MAIVLREINAEIVNFQYEFIPGTVPPKLLVKGEVAKQIFYVTNDGFVRHQDAVAPFSASLELPGLIPGMNVNVNAEIEHISPRLINNGSQVEQQILIKVTVTSPFGGLIASRQFMFQSIETLEEPTLVKSLAEEWFIPEAETEEPASPVNDLHLPLYNDISTLLQEELSALEGRLRWEIEQSLRRELQVEMDLELEIRLEEAKEQLKEEVRLAELAKQQKLEQARDARYRKSIEQSIHGFKVRC